MTRYVFVDVEAAAGPSPFSGVMTEFGAVDFTTRETFHGVLRSAHLDPPDSGHYVLDDAFPPHDLGTVMAEFSRWLRALGDSRLVMVSDNPAFDFMWIADGFDRAGLPNPLGYSARRIGDLHAGLSGNWLDTNGWKALGSTTHDHNPVNDALRNAEAFEELLAAHGQRLP